MLNAVQVFVNVCPFLFAKLSTKQDITSTEISYQFLAPKVPVLRRNKVTNSSTSTDPFSAATKTLVLGNLFKHVWFAITFARAVCHWREWQEWDNCQIFFIVFIPKWQTFRANVMSRTLNKTLFTWSGGPRSSRVGFFCFVSSRAWKQKKRTPLDRGPPLHTNRP